MHRAGTCLIYVKESKGEGYIQNDALLMDGDNSPGDRGSILFGEEWRKMSLVETQLSWRYLKVTPEDMLSKLSILWARSSRTSLAWTTLPRGES